MSNNIRPDHIEWLSKQLQLRQVRIENGALLKIMNDFWSKNGPRLSARNIKGDTACQILNNKLLDVLLKQFQAKTKESPQTGPGAHGNGVQVLERAVEDRMVGPAFNAEGNPTQTPQWVDRPSAQALKAMKNSESDEKMKEFNLTRDELFPKPKPVDFSDQSGNGPDNFPPMDKLYAQLLAEREKEAEKMGLSALTPKMSENDAPIGSTMSATPQQMSNAPVPTENPSGSVEMELRIANTLPKPVQGSKTLPGVSGVRPMPRVLPTGSVPPVQQPVDKIAPPTHLPNQFGQTPGGPLLPPELAAQANGPTKEEFMRMADEQTRADRPKNTPMYEASGAFQSIQGKEPVKPTMTSTSVSKGFAPVAPGIQSTSYHEQTQPQQVASMTEGFTSGPTPANSAAVTGFQGATPAGGSIFPASQEMADETREQWRQERDRWAAQMQGAPTNPITDIGKPILPTYFPEYQTFNWYLTIDSIHRDLEVYPNPNYFQVRFEEPSESIEVPTRLGPNGVVIYEQPKTFEYVGGKGAKMYRTYTNVVAVGCTQAIIPMGNRYIYGKPPYVFNGPQIDENKVASPNQFTSWPYGPVFQSDYGIPRDVLDEPYLCMHVEELDGLYDGTSKTIRDALAVLSYDSKFPGNCSRPFLHFTTAHDEKKVYTPTALGKLSQMTIRLLNRNNRPINLGIDKTYIEKIEEGDVVPSTVCDIQAGQHLTKITISATHPQYEGQTLCGANVDPGDLLYFFSIFPCNPLKEYTPLNSDITLDMSSYPYSEFAFVSGMTSTVIDVNPFLSIGDIVVVNQEYLFDITAISTDGKVVTLSLRGTSGIDPATLTVTSVGYIKRRRRGLQSDQNCDLTTETGQYVVGSISQPLVFQIRYPYENLPQYLRSDNGGTYEENEAFFIRRDRQIVYSVEVTVSQPRTDQLTSRIFGDGGRPM